MINEYIPNRKNSNCANNTPSIKKTNKKICSNCGFEYDSSEIETYYKDGEKLTICNDCKEADNDWQQI